MEIILDNIRMDVKEKGGKLWTGYVSLRLEIIGWLL
jgi:hypothetical protein